jgi:hypothetical protein
MVASIYRDYVVFFSKQFLQESASRSRKPWEPLNLMLWYLSCGLPWLTLRSRIGLDDRWLLPVAKQDDDGGTGRSDDRLPCSKSTLATTGPPPPPPFPRRDRHHSVAELVRTQTDHHGRRSIRTLWNDHGAFVAAAHVAAISLLASIEIGIEFVRLKTMAGGERQTREKKKTLTDGALNMQGLQNVLNVLTLLITAPRGKGRFRPL